VIEHPSNDRLKVHTNCKNKLLTLAYQKYKKSEDEYTAK
jgi:hypothetical protein